MKKGQKGRNLGLVSGQRNQDGLTRFRVSNSNATDFACVAWKPEVSLSAWEHHSNWSVYGHVTTTGLGKGLPPRRPAAPIFIFATRHRNVQSELPRVNGQSEASSTLKTQFVLCLHPTTENAGDAHSARRSAPVRSVPIARRCHRVVGRDECRRMSTSGATEEDHVPHDQKLDAHLAKMNLDDATLRAVMGKMGEMMDRGLSSDPDEAKRSSLKMLSSYVCSVPDGSESGDHLALDLGGTNFRVLRITLEKNRHAKQDGQIYVMPHELMVGNGDKFDHIADCLASFVRSRKMEGRQPLERAASSRSATFSRSSAPNE